MRTVAVIEDDQLLAGSLQQLFEADGLQAICYPDPPPVDELARHSPDLIVLDCILTTMSGPDFLKSLRGHPDLQDTPVIVTTGHDEIYDSLRKLEGEHVVVLRKPLSGTALREAARKLHAA